MYQRSLFRLLVSPSLLSGTTTTLLSFVVLGYSAWKFITENQLFYTPLFGAYGIKTALWQATGSASFERIFLNNPIAYYVMVLGVAVMVGLVVYAILQAVGLVVRLKHDVERDLHDNRVSHEQLIHDLLVRLGLRLLAVVGWIAYAGFFISTLLPFCILLATVGVAQITTSFGWQCAAGMLLLLFALHLHVVFARLCILKPRLFGGDRAIAEAEAMADADVPR